MNLRNKQGGGEDPFRKTGNFATNTGHFGGNSSQTNDREGLRVVKAPISDVQTINSSAKMISATAFGSQHA